MRAGEFTPIGESKKRFVEMFSKFLPLAMHYLELDSLPKMVFEKSIGDEQQPTFGKFVNEENALYVALANRHPNDILRTVAHELQHYKQGTEHRLDLTSGETGSPIENEAHAMAGIVMRHFNKKYPEYLSDRPVIAEGKEQFNYELAQKGFHFEQEINGVTYKVFNKKGGADNINIEAVAPDGEVIGFARFWMHQYKDGLESLITQVSDAWQGKGIATNMYAVMRMLGVNIHPATFQTDQGKAMWNKWRKQGDAQHITGMNAKVK